MAKRTKKVISKKVPKPPLPEETEKIKKIKIRVIGIGGGGGNIVSEIAQRIKNRVSFFAANTDLKALNTLPRNVEKFQFGQKLTQGLGTGMNPEIAKAAAKSERERIKQILEGQNFVILIACLGGGVASGASSIFAKISQNLGNLTYGIFTLPFSFEGEKKMEIAKDALRKLRRKLNAFTILPNERIFQIIERGVPLKKSLSVINKSLADSLQNLIEIIFLPGLINIDFADLKTIFEGRGALAYLNVIEIEKDEEKEAIEKALNSPLYPYNIEGAKGVLFNISGPKDLSLAQVSQISKMIFERVDKEAKIIFGISRIQPRGRYQKNSGTKVTLLATGCGKPHLLSEPKQKKKKTTTRPPPEGPKRKFGRAVGGVASHPSLRSGRAPKIQPATNPPPKFGEGQKPKKTTTQPSAGPLVKKIKMEKPFTKPENPKATQPSAGYPIRKNALSIKKEVEEEEAKMIAKEKFWETPAFLRKKLNKI
jgi:cell division protein FtsZ